MKSFPFSFQTLIMALRYQKKVFCTVVCLFALVGCATGWFYAGRTAAGAMGSADLLVGVCTEELLPTVNYYSDCQNALTIAHSNASQYLKVVQSSDLSPEQKKAADALSLRLTELDADLLAPIRTTLSLPTGIYVPEAFLDEYARSIEQQLFEVRLNLISEEAANELLKTMNPPDLSDEKILNTYNSLFSRASNYGIDLRRLEVLTQQTAKLADREALIADGQQLEQALEQAERVLNTLINDVNALASTVAAENFLSLRLTYDDASRMTAELTHTHDATLPQDNFLLMFVFCIMIGVFLGLFLSVAKEARRNAASDVAEVSEK